MPSVVEILLTLIFIVLIIWIIYYIYKNGMKSGSLDGSENLNILYRKFIIAQLIVVKSDMILDPNRFIEFIAIPELIVNQEFGILDFCGIREGNEEYSKVAQNAYDLYQTMFEEHNSAYVVKKSKEIVKEMLNSKLLKYNLIQQKKAALYIFNLKKLLRDTSNIKNEIIDRMRKLNTLKLFLEP